MNKALRSALFGLPLLFISCVGAQAPSRAPVRATPPLSPLPVTHAPSVENVILVTIDGVRWQEIFHGMEQGRADAAGLPHGEGRTARGLTPHLHALFFDEGTVLGNPELGERFVASGPRYYSLPAYVEIMTGAVSGCTGNDCQPEVPWTIAAEIARRGAESQSAVFSSWGTIARAVPVGERIVRRLGRGATEEQPAFPGHGDYRPDRATAAAAIDHLVHQRPRMLWVALGDTDEWAHRNDYRGYVESLRFADAFVGELCAHLADMGAYGERTVVMVTADHGRDEGFVDHGGPDSASVWLLARGGVIPAQGERRLSRRRYLRDLAPTIASLYGLDHRKCASCGEVVEELF